MCEIESFTQCMLELNAAVTLNLGYLAVNVFSLMVWCGQKVTGLNVLVVGIEKWRLFLSIMPNALNIIIFKILAQSSVG